MARDAPLFVRSLTVEERHTLQDLYHRTPDALLKSRCHILLLSADGHRVPQCTEPRSDRQGFTTGGEAGNVGEERGALGPFGQMP